MTNIIFDFDGTIADTFPMVVELVSEWINRKEPVTDEELQRLRNLPMHKVLEELGIPPWRVPGMLVRGRREMGNRISEIHAVKGMPEVIKELHDQGHTMYIMSSNGAKNIREFLKANDLREYFKRIYGGVGLLGKASALKKVIKDNDLSDDHSFYIGDEIRDIHAAQKVGIKIISVTWGYNGPDILVKGNPTALAKSPADLFNILSR